MTKKTIDVVVYLTSVKDCRKLIKSAEEKTNFIIADVLCNDETKEYKETLKEKDNVTVIDTPGAGVAKAFNECKKHVVSKYVTFTTDTALRYMSGAIVKMRDYLKENKPNIASLKPIRNDECAYKFAVLNYSKGTKIDLLTHPQNIIMCTCGYFFKNDLIKDIEFNESLEHDSEIKFLLDLFLKSPKYDIVAAEYKLREATEGEYFDYVPQFSKSWYTDSMDNFLCTYVKEDSPLFVKYAVMYLIQCRYACNLNARDKAVLNPKEAKEFFEKTGQAIRNIDDYIISNNNIAETQRISKYITFNLLKLKYDDLNLEPKHHVSKTNVVTTVNDAVIGSLSPEKIEIKVMYFDGENLNMDGIFPGSYMFKDDEIKIVARINEKEYEVRRNEVYSLNKVFNIPIKKSYTFHFSVPSAELPHSSVIAYFVVYRGEYYQLAVKFERAQTKLSSKFPMSYWVFDKKIIIYNNKQKIFFIQDATPRRLLSREVKLIKSFIKKKGDEKWRNVGLRLAYWITKPFYDNKKIWITMDKIFKGGDNGEYLFKYVMKEKPKGIKMYYMVNKDSLDYKRLKKQYHGNVLKFNSLRHKITALHADMILATHVDVMNCSGFPKPKQQYFKDLFNARIACIAHGLTIQKIAQYQNRVFDNTVLYFFASQFEVDNVSHPIYDYYDKSMLKLTGHARYDGLISDDKKQILITPTWRRGTTTGSTEKGVAFGHSDTFKNSVYYNVYNRLINDKKLIESAKKNGYKIIYLLHPAMSAQIDDFDRNDFVELVPATGDMSYEKILTESSLMVTDYSGVQFDFAYMKKPLVYYHPNELPPQYEAGGMIYDKDGFGPICVDNESVVNTLCEYMDNQCQMTDMYKERVDRFFAYDDHNNCERILKEVLDFQNKFDKANKVFAKK